MYSSLKVACSCKTSYFSNLITSADFRGLYATSKLCSVMNQFEWNDRFNCLGYKKNKFSLFQWSYFISWAYHFSYHASQNTHFKTKELSLVQQIPSVSTFSVNTCTKISLHLSHTSTSFKLKHTVCSSGIALVSSIIFTAGAQGLAKLDTNNRSTGNLGLKNYTSSIFPSHFAYG